MTKPPYRVPSMAEIEALPWNGYRVASTFSGCGGSCLGYRMAGYRVVYANEFIEEAQRTYKANHPNSFLDTRDIRQVKPEDVLERAGVDRGELDLFDGSPPCSAFSTAGKRAAGVTSEEIVEKELSLSGVQRPVVESQLGGAAYLWFKFGDFAGWLIEKPAANQEAPY
jgi:hypothetical protein